MRTRSMTGWGGALGLLVALVTAGSSWADSLSRQLSSAAGSSAGGRAVLESINRSAIAGSSFATAATAPSFTFTYDPDLQIFQRSSQSFGPLFTERATTVGAGRVSFGLTYLYVDFMELDGNDLDSLSATRTDPLTGGTATVDFSSFSLTTHSWSFTGTYGLSDRWDVNVLVPLLYTTLDAGGTVTPSTSSGRIGVDDSKFGLGDVLVRTKYRLPDSGRLESALGLSVRLPTGEENDYQGLGDTVIQPFVVLSTTVEAFDFHASLGFDANAADFERSRVRYTAGTTIQVLEQFALLFDFLGDSGIDDDAIGGGIELDRTDNFFAAPGVKVAIANGLTAYGGVIVPLTRDGLQADAIPSGAIEYTF